MRKIKVKSTAVLITAAMLLTGCGESTDDTPESQQTQSIFSAEASSEQSSTPSSSKEETSEPTVEKTTMDIFEVLPEIPVTDVSKLEYRYDEQREGIVVTDFLTDDTAIRIPDKIDGKPVVAVRLNEGIGEVFDISVYDTPEYKKYDITELILPDTVRELYSPCQNMFEGYIHNAPALDRVEYINYSSNFGTTTCSLKSVKVLYIAEGQRECLSLPDYITTLYIPSTMNAFSENSLMRRNGINAEPNTDLKKIYYYGKEYTSYTDELHHLINDVNGDGFLIYERSLGDGTVWQSLDGFCSKREEVVIPDGVTDIYAFFDNSTMKTVTIPASVERIIGSAITNGSFDGCSELTTVKFEEGSRLNSIDGFNSCLKLKSIVIPDGVSKIGAEEGAFSNCSSLESVTIPDSVTFIMGFYSCANIKEITFGDSINTKIKWEEVFSACKDNPDLKIRYRGMKLNGFDEFRKVLDGVDYELLKKGFEVKDGVLERYTGNEKNVTVPDGVTTIGADAFLHKEDIISISFPASVKSIEGYFDENEFLSFAVHGPFVGCTNLEKIVFEGGLEKISTPYVFCASSHINNAYWCHIKAAITYKGTTYDDPQDFFAELRKEGFDIYFDSPPTIIY